MFISPRRRGNKVSPANGLKRRRSVRRASAQQQDLAAIQLRKQFERKRKAVPRLLLWNWRSSTASIFGMVLGLIVALIDDLPQLWREVLQGAISVSTVFLVYALWQFWQQRIEVLVAKDLLRDDGGLFASSFAKHRFLAEVFVSLLHVPPGLGYLVGGELFGLPLSKWNILLALRCYVLMRVVRAHFKRTYISTQVRLLGVINKVSFNSMFTVKALLRVSPFKFLFSSMFVCVLLAAMLLQVKEQAPYLISALIITVFRAL